MVDLFFNGVCLWLFLFTFHDLSELWDGANLIFAVSGLVVPGLFRLVAFKGIERMGASAATAVLNSAPLFAVLLAMLLLDEQPGPANLLGAVAVVCGLVFLSWKGESRSWRPRDIWSTRRPERCSRRCATIWSVSDCLPGRRPWWEPRSR